MKRDLFRKLCLPALVGMAFLFPVACGEEKSGLESALDDAKEAAEDAAEDVEEAVENAAEAVEDAAPDN